MTFLIADDSRSIRALMKLIVTELGHTVIDMVNNGCAAVAEYDKTRPDVVLMDINMPLMNGIDALKIITDNFEDAVVIMTTAQGDGSFVTSAKQAGASQYILKPLTKKKLQDALNKIFPDYASAIKEESSASENEQSEDKQPVSEASKDETSEDEVIEEKSLDNIEES